MAQATRSVDKRRVPFDRDPEAPDRITCTCSRQPLLARAGIENGRRFVHIRATKSGRVLTDVRVTEGTIWLKCRECLREHRIVINRQRITGPTVNGGE